MQAIDRQTFPGNVALQQQWNAYCNGCVQPGLDYLNEKLGNATQNPTAGFKAARVFSPSKVNEMQPSPGDVDELQALPFTNEEDIEGWSTHLHVPCH